MLLSVIAESGRDDPIHALYPPVRLPLFPELSQIALVHRTSSFDLLGSRDLHTHEVLNSVDAIPSQRTHDFVIILLCCFV